MAKTPIKSKFFNLLIPFRKDILYLYLYALLGGAVALTFPLSVQAIIGFITAGQVNTSWGVLILIAILGTIISGILQISQISLIETIQQKLFVNASFDIASRIPKMKIEKLLKYYPPELINRFFDIITIQKGLSKILTDFTTALVTIFFGLLLISFYHPIFFGFGFVFVFILTLIIYFVGPYGLESSIKESKYKYEVAYWLQELARTFETFKLAGDTDLPLAKTDKLLGKYLENRTKHFRILVLQYINFLFFKVLVTAGFLIVGSYLVVSKELNIGQFVAAEIVIIALVNSAEKIIITTEVIYDVLTAIDKISYLTEIELDDDNGVKFDSVNNDKGIKIKLNEVSFKFHEKDFYGLKNINLTVNSNERVMVAGLNGSGKTTLISLISGLYEEYDGQISFNDIPHLNINRKSLHSYVGDSLSQELVFKGTLEENILISKENIDLKTLTWAVEQVGLNEFVNHLPNGYQTVLQPDDRKYPKSILKKIILARSFAEKPKLIVMDDFLSGLDKYEKLKMVQVLTDSKAPWTLVITGNDRELAQACNRIIVLENGAIIFDGTYDEIKQKPYYEFILE